MPSPSAIFTEMVTSTDRTWGSKVTDNVTKHNLLLRVLKDKGKIKSVGGGIEICEPLEYAENSTVQRYAGYDTLNVNASDVLTTAKYNYRSIALHVTASGQELLQNMGEEQMINLVKARKENALKTAANFMSQEIYSDGSLAEQINGLAALIQTNGQGTVGGINSATFPFWRNKFLEITGSNAWNSTNIVGFMNTLYYQLTRGVDTPDLIIMSQDFYSAYESSQQQLQRYSDADKAQAGFITLKYKKADVWFDDNANFSTTAERAYFLNTDYLSLVQNKHAAWKMDEEKKPTNQHAVVIPMYWMGNLVCTNRSLQGVMIDAA